MTDKEFKRLSRAQLIDIIYQLQLQVDDLTGQNKELKKALADKRLRIDSAGNIAEAALEINDCLRNTQKAAEQYLNEIKVIRAEAEAECARLVIDAKAEAEAILSQATKRQGDFDSALDVILTEFGNNHSDNG